MSKKTRKIISIIALVFMALFTVSIVLTFCDRTLFNNAIGYFTIFTGGIGIALFVVLKLSPCRDDFSGQTEEPADDGNDRQPSAEQRNDTDEQN